MELTLEDLIEKCPTCGGTGQPKGNAEGAQGTGSSYGRQPVAIYTMSSKCHTCDGTGYFKLTPTGRVIKQFIDILQRGRTSSE